MFFGGGGFGFERRRSECPVLRRPLTNNVKLAPQGNQCRVVSRASAMAASSVIDGASVVFVGRCSGCPSNCDGPTCAKAGVDDASRDDGEIPKCVLHLSLQPQKR